MTVCECVRMNPGSVCVSEQSTFLWMALHRTMLSTYGSLFHPLALGIQLWPPGHLDIIREIHWYTYDVCVQYKLHQDSLGISAMLSIKLLHHRCCIVVLFRSLIKSNEQKCIQCVFIWCSRGCAWAHVSCTTDYCRNTTWNALNLHPQANTSPRTCDLDEWYWAPGWAPDKSMAGVLTGI